MNGPLSPDELRLIDAYWRAANDVSVGQRPGGGDTDRTAPNGAPA